MLKPEKSEKHIKSVEEIFPKDLKTNEIKKELNDIKIREEKLKE